MSNANENFGGRPLASLGCYVCRGERHREELAYRQPVDVVTFRLRAECSLTLHELETTNTDNRWTPHGFQLDLQMDKVANWSVQYLDGVFYKDKIATGQSRRTTYFVTTY